MKTMRFEALITALARMPARQLTMLTGGVLAIVAALLWSVLLRAPLAQWRAQQDELARLVPVAQEPARLVQQLAALTAQVAALEAELARVGGATPAARQGPGVADANTSTSTSASAVQLGLVGAVDRAAARHAVLLRGAVPGPARSVAGFDEVSIEVEAVGSYQALIDWLRDIDSGAPALVSFDTAPGQGAGTRVMKIRLAAYVLAKETQ